MTVSINITKKEYGFINPDTGEEISREKFVQKHSRFGMGGLGTVLSGEKNEAEEGASN